jgi:cytoskeletal protein CcmA (bactofilin family)
MWFPKVLILTIAMLGPVLPLAGIGTAADFVVIGTDDTIPDDLYAAGNVVDVRGVVEGDVSAVASQRVVVSGTIEGDLIAIAPFVEVSGEVMGSVRAIADRVSIVGTVGEDVVVAGRRATVQGTIGGDMLTVVQQARILGSVERNVKATAIGVIAIEGEVGGDLEVNADRLEISPAATVAGDIRYRGEAEISPAADLASAAIELGKTPVPLRVRALLLAGEIVAGLLVLLGGLSMFWLAPRLTDAASGASRNWLKGALAGAAVLMLPAAFVVAVIAGMGAASPDLYGVALLATSPIAILYLAMLSSMIVLGWVPLATGLGQVVTRARFSTVGSFMIGVLILVGISLVPVVGWRLLLALWVVGVGGWVLGARSLRHGSIA